MIEGIDGASFQGYPDWYRISRAGKEFGFWKATQGIDYINPTFEHSWHGMKVHGLIRGAYHYLIGDVDGSLQADYLHAAVRARGRFGYLDMVGLDVEGMLNEHVEPAVFAGNITRFVHRARQQIAKQVVIYSTRYFWMTAAGNPDDAVVRNCPWWGASWGQVPEPPDGWAVTSFWQYSGSGRCPGVQGEVDLDRFLGTRGQLLKVAQFHG